MKSHTPEEIQTALKFHEQYKDLIAQREHLFVLQIEAELIMRELEEKLQQNQDYQQLKKLKATMRNQVKIKIIECNSNQAGWKNQWLVFFCDTNDEVWQSAGSSFETEAEAINEVYVYEKIDDETIEKYDHYMILKISLPKMSYKNLTTPL